MKATIERLATSITEQAADAMHLAETIPQDGGIVAARAVVALAEAQGNLNAAIDLLRIAAAQRPDSTAKV